MARNLQQGGAHRKRQ